MTPERYERTEELFLEAVSLQSASRAEYLKRFCNTDRELRREVEELLANHEVQPHSAESQPEDLTPVAGPDLVGRIIGRYRIQAELGRGGMGVVYRADDLELGRRVALKFLSPDLRGHEDLYRRFLQESKAAASLDHPNICTVYEAAESEAGPFIAMAFVDGETLCDRMEQGLLSIRDALAWAVQVGLGLEAARARDIVHRDIKPENLMIAQPPTGSRSGLVKILDFGVAQLADGTPSG